MPVGQQRELQVAMAVISLVVTLLVVNWRRQRRRRLLKVTVLWCLKKTIQETRAWLAS